MPQIGVTGEVSESKLFEWKIANFFSLSTEKDAYYGSPSFRFNNTSLNVGIYPGGEKRSKSGFLSLYLRNKSISPLCVNLTAHIKRVDGALTGSITDEIAIEPLEGIGWENYYDRSLLEKYKSKLVPSGILTIVCVLKLNQDGEQTLQTSLSGKRRINMTELDVLSENLMDLSTNKDSCDVVLEVQEKEFKAHRAILMARSSVFAAMFQHDTLEKQTGIIKITDCDAESFQEFLDYLYCGKLENVSFRSAFHLYCTSNKYDVQKLKEFCIQYLIGNLTPDNVPNIYKLADEYDETNLIKESQIFFNENLSRIFPTTEWQNLMKNDLRLANKLLLEYSKAKSSQ